MRDDDGDRQYGLEIVRLSPDGDAVATTTFEEIPGPRENLFYDEAGVHELPVDGPFKLGSTRTHLTTGASVRARNSIQFRGGIDGRFHS
jgi:hypothetical protein